MRFFASLGVMQYHLWQNYFGIAINHPGTDFFLVIVGVVAAYTQATQISKGTWWAYISARYRRLYVTFVPLFFIALLAKWDEVDARWALKSFFFIPIPDRLPIIGCTWMVSMFLLFYFVFSVCYLAKTEKILWLLFPTWTAVIIMYNLLGWKPGISEHWANLFFSDRNFNFIMGYGVGMVVRNGWLKVHHAKIVCWAGLAWVTGGVLILNSGVHEISRVMIIGMPVAIFLLGLTSLEQKKAVDRFASLFTAPWLVWLGGTSYVIYLSHGIVFQAWSRVLPVTAFWALPMTVGAILVGALGFILWEQPVLRYLKSGKWVAPRLSTFSNKQRQIHKGP